MAKLKPYRINQQLRTNFLNLCVMLAACFTSPEHALGKRRARIPHCSNSALRCIFSPHNATWHFPLWAQILTLTQGVAFRHGSDSHTVFNLKSPFPLVLFGQGGITRFMRTLPNIQ